MWKGSSFASSFLNLIINCQTNNGGFLWKSIIIFWKYTWCVFGGIRKIQFDKQVDIILITCMPKTEKDQLKEKEQLLRKFIEALSKKEISKCNTMVVKMDDPVFGHAKTCINLVAIQTTFSKQKSDYIIEIKHLKEQIKTLREDKERLNRVKGFKLVQGDKQKNDILSVFQLLKDGLYVEANRTTMRPFPFIQELIQYSSIKKILNSMLSRQKVEEKVIYGGEQYRQLRKCLYNQYEMFNNLSSQIEHYLQKIDGISDEQEWPKPKCIHDFLFVEFKNIQLKLRVYRNKIICLSEIVNQNPSDLPQSQMMQLAKSSDYEVMINQEQRQLTSRIRAVHKIFAKNSNRSLINKTTTQILSQIQEYILKLQKTNEYLSKKFNINNEQVNDKIVIMSLEQRVAQLEKIQQKLIGSIKVNIRNIQILQSQQVIEQIYDNDVDNILKIFGKAVNGLLLQRDEREKQFANLIKERDNYKNEFNKLNMLSNISEQMQSQLEMMRNSSSEEVSFEELKSRIQELQIKITSLERDKEEMTKIITSQSAEMEQFKKTVKQRQNELSEIRSEIYAQERHMKSQIKNQKEKIKVLQMQNSMSLFSSGRSDVQVFENQPKMAKKETNEFLKVIREINTQSNQNQKLNKLIAQIGQLKSQKQQITDQINILSKQNLRLKQACATLQKKINKKQVQIQELVDLSAQKDQMLEQAYGYNKQLQQSRCDEGIKQVTSVIVQSVFKAKSQQKKTCEECRNMITENEKYKLKAQEMKSRVQQLYRKNLKIYEESLQAAKEKRFLSSQLQKIKVILYETQVKLQQSQLKSKVLKQSMSKIQQTNTLLKNQNQQLRSTIISSRAIQETQYIHRPIQSANFNSQLPNKPHLFTAKAIFEAHQQRQRLFLIQTLEAQIGRIYQTKFLYSFDSLNKVNFHRYIDGHKHLVLIIKTMSGKLVAGYSESQVSINGTYRGDGLLLALWSGEFFRINQGKKPVTYDDYFLIFGNSELRIKSQQDRVFSNFGIANGYFHYEKKKVQHLLGQTEREVDIQTYEIYSVVFQ